MLDETTLRRLYVEEKRSIRAIAALTQIPTRTVYDALIHYRIPRRPAGFRGTQTQSTHIPLDETRLRQWYQEERRSIRSIATLAQVSTRVVYNALIRYRIPRRTVRHQQPPAAVIQLPNESLDESTLRRLYVDEGQSIAAIAAAAQCAPSRIRNALVRWGIPRRRRGRR